MRRTLAYVMVALAIALLVGSFRIYSLPKRLMAERTYVYLEQAGGYNRFVHQRLPDASWREFVSPSPDLMYSYLVFDTARAPVAIEIPAYDDYWINQMVDDRTDTFGYVGHDTSRSDVSKFVVYSDATPAFDVPEGFSAFKSPSPTGVFLLRYLVRAPDSIDRINATRQKIRVWEMKPGAKNR